MKPGTRALVLYLPLMVVLTLLGWLVFGALPGIVLTGDLLAWLMELPVVTCYALAAGGATLVTMQWTGLNIPNETRAALMTAAAGGDRAAQRVLNMEALQWFAFLTLFAVFFFPHY